MPSSFASFSNGDVVEASHVAEMHAPIQNLERGAAFYAGTTGGSSTAYSATLSPAPDNPYQAGMIVNFKIHADNTAGSPDVTLNVNGVGAKPILKGGGDSLAAGDLKVGQVVSLVFDPDAGASGAFKLLALSSIGWSGLPFDQAIGNTILGNNSLVSNTGNGNTAVGFEALRDNTEGGENTAVGYQSLAANTSGGNNVAVGHFALQGNTDGSYNIGIGQETLYANAGNNNTVVGCLAMGLNGSGSDNCVLGMQALRSNTTGGSNVAAGYNALFSNTTGDENTALGYHALFSNTGARNTVVGSQACYYNTTGSENAALGQYCLANATEGDRNTVLGYGGGGSLTTGSNNIVIGANVDVPDGTADYQINIGDAFQRAAGTKAVSLRAGSVAYANSADENVLDLTNRSGWLNFVDSTGSKCRAFVTVSTVTIEAGSADWVASSTPASGEVGLYVSSSQLRLVLGSAAARSIGFIDQLVQF